MHDELDVGHYLIVNTGACGAQRARLSRGHLAGGSTAVKVTYHARLLARIIAIVATSILDGIQGEWTARSKLLRLRNHSKPDARHPEARCTRILK